MQLLFKQSSKKAECLSKKYKILPVCYKLVHACLTKQVGGVLVVTGGWCEDVRSVCGYCGAGAGGDQCSAVFTPWDNKLSALSHRPGIILPVKSCPVYELNKV